MVRLILISTISIVNISAKAYALQQKKKLLRGFFCEIVNHDNTLPFSSLYFRL